MAAFGTFGFDTAIDFFLLDELLDLLDFPEGSFIAGALTFANLPFELDEDLEALAGGISRAPRSTALLELEEDTALWNFGFCSCG